MLKFQLDNLDGLDDAAKTLYVEKDGKFQLGIEGLPEDKSAEYETRIGKMDAKIQELLDEKKTEAEKRRAAEEEARKEAEEAARKSGDIEALEASWQQKHDKAMADLRAELEPEVNEYKQLLNQATVEATATKIASEIGIPGSAKALLPHLQARLAMEIRDGKATTVVRGVDGKPSALTIEELKNEFIGDAAFAPLIVGSKASGGGASGGDGGAGEKTLKRSAFESKSHAERRAFMKEGGKLIDD